MKMKFQVEIFFEGNPRRDDLAHYLKISIEDALAETDSMGWVTNDNLTPNDSEYVKAIPFKAQSVSVK